MQLKQNYKSIKFDNVTTYYFKNELNEISLLEISKLKSGYEVNYKNYHLDFFKRTDGLKNIKQINEFIKNFKF